MRGMDWSMRAVGSAVLLCAGLLDAGEIPRGPLPEGVGLNVHFVRPLPGEIEMIRDAGFKVVRVDMRWELIEIYKDKYRWTAYEALFDACRDNGIRVMAPFMYTNPHYDEHQSPRSDEAIAAFTRYAVETVKYFQGRGIIWEMYNEPNLSFWKPAPNVMEYIRLATSVGEAIRAEAPDEIFVGPALSGTDGDFLEACFRGGLLNYFDAVTVHPYSKTPPEDRQRRYRGTQLLIERYQPAGRRIPVVCGEWGYNTAEFSEELQAKYLARGILTNVASGLPLTIWYTWRDNGVDPKNPQHRYGIVRHEPIEGGERPFEPKPAYVAARTLTTQLRDCTFVRRIPLRDTKDTLLVFQHADGSQRAVVWTMWDKPRTTLIPANIGAFEVVSLFGEALPGLQATPQGLRLEISDGPVYLKPASPQPRWTDPGSRF